MDRLTYRVHLEETVDLVVEVDMGHQEMLLEQLVDAAMNALPDGDD